jgi:hypothetical protein
MSSLLNQTAGSVKTAACFFVEIRDRARGSSQKQLIYRKWQ